MIDYAPHFLESKSPEYEDIEKLFLCYQSAAFMDQQDQRYEVSKKISKHFNISISSIRFCGSAHIGSSPHKNTPFAEETSDLDVAIVDGRLFEHYLLASMDNSRSLQDPSCFPIDGKTKISTKDAFCLYAARGMFRPDLMPNCPQRRAWIDFFSIMSRSFPRFKSINAGLYLSERFFIEKQRDAVKMLRVKGRV